MNFLTLCSDHNIDTAGPEHHHVSQGWIGIHCPFCTGKQNFHMGFNISKEFFNCWRCGPHSLRETLERLTGEAFGTLWRMYGEGKSAPSPTWKGEPRKEEKELVLPNGFTQPLRDHHRQYLERRQFDPDELIKEWGVCSTSPTAVLHGAEHESHYGNRIFIPMYWNGKLATFQARALKTPKHKEHMKYKACPAEMEGRSIRRILYRHPETVSDYGFCVEGVTDVWRLGLHAFALLGTGFSEGQVALIAELYSKVILLFDPEDYAQARALKMQLALRAFGIKATIHSLPDERDPAELNRQEVSMLVQHLLNV
ncbi:hypothetical protein LCGC14_2579500 [marine sediment metagenome]|uniref:Zinc finger CHC2-type domain-containing protein n=1 Tax=marine sediment metagenome TaxID=412755 RepID=A0A0F9B2P4_9ZZZZ